MNFYCAMHFSAKRGLAIDRMSSVCLCLSVTMVICDHIGWNSSKIISRLVSEGFLLSVDSNITDLFQTEYPQIFAGIGVA